MTPYYERDGITIFHADCRELLATMDAGSVDAVVTSPPYNQLGSLPASGSGLWGKSTGGAGFLRKWNEMPYRDSMPEEEYQQWQNAMFSLIATVCTECASLFYNHQIRWRDSVCIHPVHWFRPEFWNLRQEIIWDRGGGMMLNARMFCRFEERILWFVKGSWKWNQSCVGFGTIWRLAREQQQQGKIHPVQFPLEIPERCIMATTDQADTILDPFAGSCTTGVAAWNLGRKAILCEIDEKYCELGAKRLDRIISQGRLFKPEPVQETQRELFADAE